MAFLLLAASATATPSDGPTRAEAVALADPKLDADAVASAAAEDGPLILRAWRHRPGTWVAMLPDVSEPEGGNQTAVLHSRAARFGIAGIPCALHPWGRPPQRRDGQAWASMYREPGLRRPPALPAGLEQLQPARGGWFGDDVAAPATRRAWQLRLAPVTSVDAYGERITAVPANGTSGA